VENRPVKQQEAQLTLTNPRDEFRGQSRSPNNVWYHVWQTWYHSIWQVWFPNSVL